MADYKRLTNLLVVELRKFEQHQDWAVLVNSEVAVTLFLHFTMANRQRCNTGTLSTGISISGLLRSFVRRCKPPSTHIAYCIALSRAMS